jgi:hypothetical protein
VMEGVGQDRHVHQTARQLEGRPPTTNASFITSSITILVSMLTLGTPRNSPPTNPRPLMSLVYLWVVR